MGWLKYSNEIPDPKTRRFQELNGIKGDALRASVELKLTANSKNMQTAYPRKPYPWIPRLGAGWGSTTTMAM